MSQHRKKDTITVSHDGTEKKVYNWVNVERPYVVRGGNPTLEKFDLSIGAGDSPETPDYITHWLERELYHQFSVDPTDYGIEVVDVTADDVDIV